MEDLGWAFGILILERSGRGMDLGADDPVTEGDEGIRDQVIRQMGRVVAALVLLAFGIGCLAGFAGALVGEAVNRGWR